MAVAGLLAGLFYAHRAYVLAAVGPLLANLVTLAVAWALRSQMGIYGLALGVLIGAFSQAIFVLGAVWWRYRPPVALALGHPGVRQVGRLMAPWLLGAMIYKANPVVDRFIASSYPAGAISALGFGLMLIQVGVFVCSKGASLVVFPEMARLGSQGEPARLRPTLDAGLRLVVAAMIPVLTLLLTLTEPLVALAWQRGAFSAAAVRPTAQALLAYSGSLVALSLGNVLAYAFYAIQDTRTPALIGVGGMALNVALALALRSQAGFLAPAFAFSAMSLANLVVMALILRRRCGALVLPGFGRFGLTVMLAGMAMGAVILLIQPSLPAAGPLMAAGPPALAGLVTYGLLLSLGHRRLVTRAVGRLARRGAT
jgi:putative peptidoglycan lipid II flippase